MHRKESVIAPAFADAVGLRCVAAQDLDTDRFGTFSGEIARLGTMLETALAKARAALRAEGATLAIASEGTFAPHPQFGILPAGMELMVLIDDERSMTISESSVSLDTNFDRTTAAPSEDIAAFLERAKFPSHGLIVKPNDGRGAITKGIVDAENLRAAIQDAACASADGLAIIETDMRAHFNPTRMAAIGALARRLAARVAQLCTRCGAPGFDVTERIGGLKCLECGTPTNLITAEIHSCSACGLRETRPARHGLPGASAMHCPSCNP